MQGEPLLCMERSRNDKLIYVAKRAIRAHVSHVTCAAMRLLGSNLEIFNDNVRLPKSCKMKLMEASTTYRTTIGKPGRFKIDSLDKMFYLFRQNPQPTQRERPSFFVKSLGA